MRGTRAAGGGTGSGSVALSDRYELDQGQVFMTGVQALVRVLLDQHRADRAAGLRTGTLVSGYQGSPLAGFDKEIARLGGLGREHGIVHRPAVNEELGATAVWGSQLAGTLPGPRQDGVVGVWYGKAPGVDRSADAIRHGNYVGTDPSGGVLALVGDDPACKSSTLPSASESLLAALDVPVLAPGSIEEALDLGRHAIYLSRCSGLWAALKVVTNLADAAGTVSVDVERVVPRMPVAEYDGAPYVHRPSAHLLAPQSLEMERSLVGVRLGLAESYARLNRLDRVVIENPDAKLGVVAAGATAHDVRRALADLGCESRPPLRMLQLGMIHPLDSQTLREFAAGLDELLVIEEKGPFLERAVKEALYGTTGAPLVTGKGDAAGAPLVPAYGVLDADAIARALGSRLLEREELPAARAHLAKLDAVAGRVPVDTGAARVPYFCAGCPHNGSTAAPDEEIVGAGIGCHTMVMLSRQGHGDVRGITQMGGEGAQWIGAAPFVDVPHFTQNLGDGTFHHSGSLAVRAAVAAGLNVTYKLLFNGTVAMTGGQHIEGGMSVEAAVRALAADGVRRIAITAEDTSRYQGVDLPGVASVHERGEMLRLQRELAKVEGVTVLIHDQACATELRRARKRGRVAESPQRVFINERVCEGCGDCGEKSACLAVEPVETEFGRKTRVNQTACNKDFSCLEGDCPSFITVIPAGGERKKAPMRPGFDLPAPRTQVGREDFRARIVGIGGTGVVTVSQVLGVAAMLDGLQSSGLDQTGLSQKAGPVVSDVRLTAAPVEDGVTVPSAAADLLLGLDLLTASTAANLRVAEAGRTVAVASESVVPTAPMVLDPDADGYDVTVARAAVDAVTVAESNVYLDAQALAEGLLGDTTTANVLVLGAAWQAGLLPLSLESLEQAFRLNGVAVEQNLAALAWGRAWVVDPTRVEAQMVGAASAPDLSASDRELLDRVAPEEGELRRLMRVRIADLRGWGGGRPVAAYVDQVVRVREVEQKWFPGSTEVTEAVARNLHKLLAYKDEYEVARLHLEGLADLPAGSKLRFHLHPPLLRALGLRRKLSLGPWFKPFLRLLRHGRGLRGTPFDPFGYARVRRVERGLPAEYLAVLDGALDRLADLPAVDPVVEVARLPELIRGYEDIKLRNVERFRVRATELREQLGEAQG